MAAKKRKAPRKRTRQDADAGVRRCMDLMVDGSWVRGRTHEDVALEFGVSPATVKNWATNASRAIHLLSDTDREQIRARLLATLEHIIAEAMQTTKAVTVRRGLRTRTEFLKAPSLQAAVSAVETQAKLQGLITQHVDISQRPSVAHLSRDEHLAELAALKAEIAAEEARLATEDA